MNKKPQKNKDLEDFLAGIGLVLFFFICFLTMLFIALWK